MAKRSGRIFFLDEMRALALIGMIIYHAAYDLYAIFGLDFDFFSPGWDTLQLAVCCTFIVIAGISSRLTKNALKHGLVVFGAGMLMTIGTYFFMPSQVIWFGVLHFLGASMIIYYLIRKSINKAPALIGAMFSLAAFLCLYGISSGTILFGNVMVPQNLYFSKFLAVIGLPGPGFRSSDYFPLIPWFFLYLTGCFAGKWFKERKIPDFMMKKHSDFLCAIGSNTLVIYIVHQPIIYGLLYAFFWVIEKGSTV
ncbi:MAG: DUF1624 domain-containing protein [Oscillospiraceae bacterium]|nr:DUF1624 domain-containing protein [Oscillospiraceae bacterium]